MGNVAVGFDILGHAFDAVFDQVEARRTDAAGIQLICSGPGSGTIPTLAAANTAGRAAQAVLQKADLSWGLQLRILKGIPVASGLGGSAASAVAAAVAVSGLLEHPLSMESLLDCALEGEAVATGSRVIDNVAASLFGGLVFAVDGQPPLARTVPVPEGLYCALVHPDLAITTEASRAGLSDQVSRTTVVAQMANLAGVLLGCQQAEIPMLGRFLRDCMIEPQRASQIPGFVQVQAAAMLEGALGCSLSGSGPSIFAWCQGRQQAQAVAESMSTIFNDMQIASRHWISPVGARGAQIVERQ
ncbi:MAG: homoserine kinase [Gammaproteobacteria bacterium]|nr:homoserine kinase [Gammaproteobacteria bacterium]